MLDPVVDVVEERGKNLEMATDAAGKVSTVTRNVTLDTSVPQIVSAGITPNPADAGATGTITVVVQ